MCAALRNRSSASAIGADEVIDYTWEDFTDGTRQFDLILDTAGRRPWRNCGGPLRIKAPSSSSEGRRRPLARRLSAPDLRPPALTLHGAEAARPHFQWSVSKTSWRSKT